MSYVGLKKHQPFEYDLETTMKVVTPKVFLIASTGLETEGLYAWLDHVGGIKCLDTISGSDPEQLIELAARRCYKSFDVGLNLNVKKVRTDSEEYLKNILGQAHGSVMCHATSTWAFEDVSRVFTHELCRNVIGIKDNDSDDDLKTAEFGLSQESMRYVRLDELRVWLPPEFEEDEFARGTVTAGVEYLEEMQRKLAAHFRIDDMKFSRKKRLTSALRRWLPMGIGTGIVWTANFRALRWILEQRTSEGAEVEFRMAFNPVAEIAVKKWPYLFGDFTPVDTGDGDIKAWVPTYHKV